MKCLTIFQQIAEISRAHGTGLKARVFADGLESDEAVGGGNDVEALACGEWIQL